LALLPLLLRLNLWDEVRRNTIPLFVVSYIDSAFPFLLLAFESLSLPAGFTSILNATSPLFGTVVAILWFKEQRTLGQMVGFILGFAGVVILIGWKSFVATPVGITAIAAGLAAALMYAIAAPYIKQQLAGVPSLVTATSSQLSAALVLLPALPFTVPQQAPTPQIMLSVLALALFSTALAYLLYFRLIQNLGSTKALTVTYLIPAFAILWGAVLLQEQVTTSMIFGCTLILLGTAIANDLFKHLLVKSESKV
jgi:drug/metabolite transporter (DMT)-like permease